MTAINQPNEVSNFKLKASYWYVTHKLQLKKALIVFLIVLSIGFFSYSLYKTLMILFVYDQAFRQTIAELPANLIDYQYFHQKNEPIKLELSDFDVIKGTEDNYDFVIKLTNLNEKWIAEKVVLELISGNEVKAEKNTFVYPQQEKYFAFFNQKDLDPAISIIRVGQVAWQRYLNFAEFAEPRLNFAISEIEFKSVRESGLPGKLPISSLSFKIKNNTAYSYWQVGVFMVLLATQKVGGANYISLDQFRAGEERRVEMRWYEALPPIQEVKIIPEIDIISPASYLPPE